MNPWNQPSDDRSTTLHCIQQSPRLPGKNKILMSIILMSIKSVAKIVITKGACRHVYWKNARAASPQPHVEH